MTRQFIQITDANALSIAREIADDQQKLKDNMKALEDNYVSSREVLINNYNKKSAENLERLRFAMSLPLLEQPYLDSRYIGHGIAFIHHGPLPKQPSILDHIFGEENEPPVPTNLQ